MRESTSTTPTGHRRLWLAGLITLVAVAVLLVWAARRETTAEKEIQRLIAELHAAGEPVSAADLVRLFPDPPPSEDALLLLSNVLSFAVDHRPPASTPIIMSGPSPLRTEALDEPMAGQLRAYCEETKTIFDPLMPWPATMRFASHWQNGMESNSIAPFQKVRSFVHLLTAHAFDAAETRDAARTTEMLARGFQFSQTVPSDSLVGHMIKQACAGLTATVTERALNRVFFTDAQLTRLADALPPANTNHLINALRGEHVLAIWAFQEIKGGRRFDDLVDRSRSRKESWWKSALRKLRPRRNEYNDHDFIAYLAFCRSSRTVLTQPPTEAITNFMVLSTAYAASVTSEIAQGVPANWTKALRTHFENEARYITLRTALAVEHHRLAHEGKLPSSLEELVPAYLPAVPRDLFDNQPLRFKPLPVGYVIYSIGADGVDDGGLEKTPATTNYDVTVTVER